MIKNYNQFINEDIRSKTIIAPKEFTIDNIKREYSWLNINVVNFNVVIGCDDSLELDDNFYEALKKDNIEPKDILFENCEEILLYDINGFTKISDYGKFGENIKDFNCNSCKNLTSLDGCPGIIYGDFDCGNCEITSLDGSPKEATGDFDCSNCKQLTSLKGSPDVVGSFNCAYCPNIESLEFAPTDIGNFFYIKGCCLELISSAKEKYGSKVMS